MQTDRGELRAPLIVDALGWRRVLSNSATIQPPKARLSRGLEVHPPGSGGDMELWIDTRYVRAGYSWNFRSEPEPALNNRNLIIPRGKTLGGSSSINGMIYVRGNPRDYDLWRQRGLTSGPPVPTGDTHSTSRAGKPRVSRLTDG